MRILILFSLLLMSYQAYALRFQFGTKFGLGTNQILQFPVFSESTDDTFTTSDIAGAYETCAQIRVADEKGPFWFIVGLGYAVRSFSYSGTHYVVDYVGVPIHFHVKLTDNFFFNLGWSAYFRVNQSSGIDPEIYGTDLAFEGGFGYEWNIHHRSKSFVELQFHYTVNDMTEVFPTQTVSSYLTFQNLSLLLSMGIYVW